MSSEAPIAKQVPIKHTYHGREFPDDYHWLKDMDPKEKRPEIIEYLKAENDYSAGVLEKTKDLSETIYNEIISRIKEDDEKLPYFRAPYFYYTRTVKGLQYPIYCRKKDSLENKEEVLLDLNQRTEEYIDLHSFEVSPDHRIVAYAIDFTGDEYFKVYFKNLETGEDIEETMPVCTGDIEWSKDGKAIFYSTMDKIHRSEKVFLHYLGSKEDKLLFHEADEQFIVEFSKSASGRFMFISTESGLTSETHYIDMDGDLSDLKLFKKREVGHTYFVEHQGSRFLVVTNGTKKYLNYRLCSCPIENTEEAAWEEVIPYDPLVNIKGVTPFKNHIVLSEVKEGSSYVSFILAQNGIMDGAKERKSIKIDADVYRASISGDKYQDYNSEFMQFEYQTPVQPPKVLKYNMNTGDSTVLKEQIVPGTFDPSQYTVKKVFVPIPEEHQVKAPSDTPVPNAIPMTVIYKTDLLKADGSNPGYLYGYGSYGFSVFPAWNPRIFSLIDRGYVYCIGQIRGGGDCGQGWYETGKFGHKKNTFHDFITCAKYMIEQKYTNSKLLCIEGRSAGGLLIGATLNMAPELFSVAVAGVPFVDVIHTMMDPTIPLTINEYEEWGNPNKEDVFDYMLSYAPYNNIPADKQFPDVLVKAGLFDPRVAYWEPAKWVAKMRKMDVNRSKSDNPSTLILDCKMGSGHFGSTGRYAFYKEIAVDYSFVIGQIQKKQ